MKKRKNFDPRTLARPRDEDALHRQVVEFLTPAIQPGVLWFHVPNGGKRDKITAGQMQAYAVLPGVADLCFMWSEALAIAVGRHLLVPSVVWLELKSTEGTLADRQQAFAERVMKLGHRYSVARTLEEAVNELRRMGVPMRARVSA